MKRSNNKTSATTGQTLIPRNLTDVAGELCTCDHSLTVHYLASSPPDPLLMPCHMDGCTCPLYTFKDRTHLYLTTPLYERGAAPSFDASAQQAIINNAAHLRRKLPTIFTPQLGLAYIAAECARYATTPAQIAETQQLFSDHAR